MDASTELELLRAIADAVTGLIWVEYEGSAYRVPYIDVSSIDPECERLVEAWSAWREAHQLPAD